MPETYCLSDIHGCYLTLQAILKRMNVKNNDNLLILGDVVDRGPRIKEVLDFLLGRPNTTLLMGNHEFSFIEYTLEPDGYAQHRFMWRQGLSQTYDQLGVEVREYAKRLADLPYVAHDESGKYVFTHSTYNWHEDEQFDPMLHLWERPFEDWEIQRTYGDYTGPIVVHGHTPAPSGSRYMEYIGDKLIGINLDGGGCFGHGTPGACLRSMRVSDGMIFEEPYCD